MATCRMPPLLLPGHAKGRDFTEAKAQRESDKGKEERREGKGNGGHQVMIQEVK